MKLSKETSLEESFAAFGDKVAAVRRTKCDKCAAFDAGLMIGKYYTMFEDDKIV